MADLTYYQSLCKIDMYNNNIRNYYPYTLKDNATFTQHEVILKYKQNYCQNIKILTEKDEPEQVIGAAENNINYSYYLYDQL